MDLITELYARNQISVLESILGLCGYNAVLSMLQVSRSWSEILSELGLWERLVENMVHNDPNFKSLCTINGWSKYIRQFGGISDPKRLAFMFYTQTDLLNYIRYEILLDNFISLTFS